MTNSTQKPRENNTWCRLPTAIMRRRDVTWTAKGVYMAIADRVGNNGTAWPSVRRLADDIGTDPKTVLRAIAGLKAAGLVSAESGIGRSNTYKLAGVGESPTGVGETPTPEVLAKCPRTVGESPPQVWAKRPPNQTKRTIPSNQSGAQTRKLDDWQVAVDHMTGTALKTETFKAAWVGWCQYKRESHKPLKVSTVRLQIKQLEKIGQDRAVKAIEHSITQGYVGLYEPKDDGGKTHGDTRNVARIAAPRGKYDGIGIIAGETGDSA